MNIKKCKIRGFILVASLAMSLTSCNRIIVQTSSSSSSSEASVNSVESVSSVSQASSSEESCLSSEKESSLVQLSKDEESSLSSESISSKDSSSASSQSSSSSSVASSSSEMIASSSESSSSSQESTISSVSSSSTYTSPNSLTFTSSDAPSVKYTQNFSVDGDSYSIVNNVKFNFYRFGVTGSSVVLYGDDSYYYNRSFGGKEGALFNVTPITGIDNISITYTYAECNDSNINPNVTFGEDNTLDDYKVSLPLQEDASTKQTYTIDVSNYNFEYLSINSGSYNLYVSDVTVNYRNLEEVSPSYPANAGLDKGRVNPVKYTGTLEPGKAKINVPTETVFNKSTNTYDVVKTTTLTYYTLDYVNSHSEVKENATITDPLLVCAYYTSFGTWPANYSTNTNGINSTFGKNARKVSKYSRTDGYAQSVPYNNYGSTGAPLYYELDVGLTTSYSTSSRDVGRIVAWDAGFNGTGYDSSPVCVYTDDHYATFQEYYNNGEFSTRFNSESIATSCTHSCLTTYTLGDIDQDFYVADNNDQGQTSSETTSSSITSVTSDASSSIVAPTSDTYYMVNSISEIDGNGEYLFVCVDYQQMSTYDQGKMFGSTNTVTAVDDDNRTYIAYDTSACTPLHIIKEGNYYYITYVEVNAVETRTIYLASTSTKNLEGTSDKNASGTKWNISIENGNAIIYTGSYYIRYNRQNPRFTTYNSSQQSQISLFKRS